MKSPSLSQNNESSLVSIILPVYNGERFLRSAVESVLAQTCPHWELLIVDDGSTDASASICDDFSTQDSRIRVFHQANGGVNAARAKGIGEASGEFLVYLDADDALLPDALAFMLGLVSPDDDLLATGQKEELLRKDAYLNVLWTGKTDLALWGKMFRTAIFRNMDYVLERRLVMGEDLLLNSMYALNVRQVHMMPRFVYLVNRENERSVTRTFKHNWTYEKYYFSKVEELFLSKCRNWDSYGQIELLVNKSWLNAMKYVMLDGGRIDYADAEFKSVQAYFRDRKNELGPSEKLLFCIRNSYLYRSLLNTYLFLKRRK